MKILIISSCTGKKRFGKNYPGQLSLADFQLGPAHVAAREAALPAAVRVPASDMYRGRQHTLTMQGISAARAAGIGVDLWILSAGYGLIPEHRVIVPYEATFRGMGQGALNAWALALGVPAAFALLVHRHYDFGLVLLGADYLRACDINFHTVFGGRTLLLGRPDAIAAPPPPHILRRQNVGPAEAGLVGEIVTAAKGEIARRFLVELAPLNAAGRTSLVGQIMNPAIDPLNLIP